MTENDGVVNAPAPNETEAEAALAARRNDPTIARRQIDVEIVAIPLGLSEPCKCGEKFELSEKGALQALASGGKVTAVCPKCNLDIEFRLKRNLIIPPGAPRNERRVLAKETEKILRRIK